MPEWISAHLVGRSDEGPVPGDPSLAALALAVQRPAWMTEAECVRRGMDVSLFVQDGTGTDYTEAYATCDACPVRSECLEEALSWGPRTEGVWGGTSAKQRRQMLREREQAA